MTLLDVAGALLQPTLPPVNVVVRELPVLSLSWTDKASGEFHFVRFDAVSAETHEALMTLTSHPVEEGANVTDHARPENKQLSIEAYVSNKPLLSNPGAESFLELGTIPLNLPKVPGAVAPTPGAITRTITAGIDAALHKAPDKASVEKPSGDFPNRAKAMWELLTKAQGAAALITVSTTLEQVDNMMIERVTSPRTVQDGNGATFQVDLKRVRIVKSETVDAPVPAESRGAKEADKGSKNAKKTDEKKDGGLKSFAAGLFDGGSGLFDKLGL